MMEAKVKAEGAAPRRSGRPTKEQAERIGEHIIDVATRLFLEASFEATSVDLIAAEARISKQTFYTRFASKDALFAAVIRKGMSGLIAPSGRSSDRNGPIETVLVRIGIEISKRALTPAAIALHRLVMSEAHQFPELTLAYRESGIESRKRIADIFSDAMKTGQLRPANARFLAEQFLYAVVEGPAREMVLDGKTTGSEQAMRQRVTAAVTLFLNGCREGHVPPG